MAITEGFLRTLRNYDGQIKVFDKDKAIIELAKMINGGGEEIIIKSVWGIPDQGNPTKIIDGQLNFTLYNGFAFSKTEEIPLSPDSDNILCLIRMAGSNHIVLENNKIPFSEIETNYVENGGGVNLNLYYGDLSYEVGYFR